MLYLVQMRINEFLNNNWCITYVLSQFREDLLGQAKKDADDISRLAGLDNQGIVGLQRKVIKGTDI